MVATPPRTVPPLFQTDSVFGTAPLGLAPGDHVAVFYRGPVERDGLLRSFYAAGLAAGQFCACLVDDDAAQPVRQLFDGRAVPVGGAATYGEHLRVFVPGQIEALRHGSFDPWSMAHFWERTIDEAVADGYSFGRLAGVMTWILDDPERLKHLAEFEAIVDELVAHKPAVGWCLYDIERLDGGILLDAARTHRKLFIDGTIIDNPYHLQPACLPGGGPLEARLRASAASLQGIVVLGRLMMLAGSSAEITRFCAGAARSLLPGCGLVAVAESPDGATSADGATSLKGARSAGAATAGQVGWSVTGLLDHQPLPSPLSRELARVAAGLGEHAVGHETVDLLGYPWSCAVPLRFSGRNLGWLFAACDRPPMDESESRFHLHALAGQAAAALGASRAAAAQQARTLELRSLSERLNQAVHDRERLLEIHQRLTDAAVAGRGPAGIAQVLGGLLHTPILVEDASGQVMCLASTSVDFRPPESVGPIRARLRSEGHAVRSQGMAAQPVMAGGRFLASIWTTFSAADDRAGAVALERAADAMKIELDHERAVADVELRTRGGITEDLVAGVDTAEAAASITRRARWLGVDLTDIRFAAVRPSGGGMDLDAVCRRLPYQLLAPRPDHVIVILHGDDDPEHLRAVSEESAGSTCGVGVGSQCRSLSDSPRSYAQALQALRALGPGPGVRRYDELGVLGVLMADGDRDALGEYVRRLLDDLIRHEQLHGGQLLETLACYLETGGSPTAAAGRLHVHANTVKYRLRRIESITGMDLSDQDVRFQMRVAVTAARATGMIGP